MFGFRFSVSELSENTLLLIKTKIKTDSCSDQTLLAQLLIGFTSKSLLFVKE